MNATKKQIEKAVYAAYTKRDGGFGSACAEANKYNNVVYEHCKACESEAPTIKGKHTCLVCGQSTTPDYVNEGRQQYELRYSPRNNYYFIDEIREDGNLTVCTFGEVGEEFVRKIIPAINSHDDMLEALKSIVGIEAWIGDTKMKELFQRKVYPAIEKATNNQ